MRESLDRKFLSGEKLIQDNSFETMRAKLNQHQHYILCLASFAHMPINMLVEEVEIDGKPALHVQWKPQWERR